MLGKMLAAAGIALAALQEGCYAAHYLGQQAGGQLHLLRIRRNVSEVISDPTTEEALRQRLQLVMEARKFGIETLGLRGGAEFTRYVDPGGPVAYNLTVSPKDALTVRSFRFPLVGRVPYLGFFDLRDAKREAQRFADAGFDVYLRPVGAYSTLGYLISPIYRSMLGDFSAAGELRAVETILHEMAHSTVFLPGASDLNESFATQVGIRGAALFYRSRGDLTQSDRVFALAKEGEADEKSFSTWLAPQIDRLNRFYKRAAEVKLRRKQLLDQREAIFEEIRQSYRQAFPEGRRYKRLADGPLSNALLSSFAVYHESSGLQEALLAICDDDLKRFVSLYREARDRRDGAEWLRRLADLQRRSVP
ncbi:MAG TPA: aminopeptidase [Pseudomonadota bacterium]|nr:aminopeptidase [Pseudomonadota bacterium]HNN53241.1 aminopeptidase [Pseudomonadota bacterium]HNO67869.1 aminopeptidase [Pseudomonadota bacterium]